MRIHHYCPGAYVLSILESGYIDTTPKKLRKFEKGVAWFSTLDEFPKTAWKPAHLEDGSYHMMTPDEMSSMLGGIFRFSCNEGTGDFLRWDMLKLKARMPQKVRTRLVRRAKALGENPSSWRGSMEPVPTSMLTLEHFDGKEWVQVPMEASSVPEIAVQVKRVEMN